MVEADDGGVRIEADIEKDGVVRWSAIHVEADLSFRHVEIVDPIPGEALELAAVTPLAGDRGAYQATVAVPYCASQIMASVTTRTVVTTSGDEVRSEPATSSLVVARHITGPSDGDPSASRLMHVSLEDPTILYQGALRSGETHTFVVQLACPQMAAMDVEILFGDDCGGFVLPIDDPINVTATASPGVLTIPAGADEATFSVSGIEVSSPLPEVPGTLTVCARTVLPGGGPILSNARQYCATAVAVLTSERADRCEGMAAVGSL